LKTYAIRNFKSVASLYNSGGKKVYVCSCSVDERKQKKRGFATISVENNDDKREFDEKGTQICGWEVIINQMSGSTRW